LERAPDHVGTSGIGEPAELIEVLVHLGRIRRALARGADQERALDRLLDLD
jgi:hypothetical protein